MHRPNIPPMQLGIIQAKQHMLCNCAQHVLACVATKKCTSTPQPIDNLTHLIEVAITVCTGLLAEKSRPFTPTPAGTGRRGRALQRNEKGKWRAETELN